MSPKSMTIVEGGRDMSKIPTSLAFLYPTVYHLTSRCTAKNENADLMVGVRDDTDWKNLGFVKGL